MFLHKVFQFAERKKTVKMKYVHLACGKNWVLLGSNRQLEPSNTCVLVLPSVSHRQNRPLGAAHEAVRPHAGVPAAHWSTHSIGIFHCAGFSGIKRFWKQ